MERRTEVRFRRRERDLLIFRADANIVRELCCLEDNDDSILFDHLLLPAVEGFLRVRGVHLVEFYGNLPLTLYYYRLRVSDLEER